MQAGINKPMAPVAAQTAGKAKTPVFPAVLSAPLRLMPASMHSRLLVKTLNRVFAEELRQGELDFLQDRVLYISISDVGIRYTFTLKQDRLQAVTGNASPDVQLEGTLYDYMLLAGRREDTDALFFNRRLHMQGDTELGLFVKNFLDGMDMESKKLPAYLESFVKKVLPYYEKLF